MKPEQYPPIPDEIALTIQRLRDRNPDIDKVFLRLLTLDDDTLNDAMYIMMNASERQVKIAKLIL